MIRNTLRVLRLPGILLLCFSLIAMSCKKNIFPDPPGTGTQEEEGEPQGPVQEKAFAFPGAEGFGKNTTGGRGGKVIKVTSLADAGAGTLRDAINQTGPRIIVFEVSGNIKLKSTLNIRNNDVTIAGQTAPGDGICVQDYDVVVDADNVIIRYMRFRMGDLAQRESDALWGRYHQNIIIDHCSISWSIDEASSFYFNKNFTMQWCFITESLNKSFHEKADHGYGGIWGGSNVSFHHNLLAHHNSRNPRFNGGARSGMTNPFSDVAENVDYRNNVLYNWGDNSAYGGENGNHNMVANYYKPGPGTPTSRNKRILEISMDANPSINPPGFGKFYIYGNYLHGNTGITSDNWAGGVDLRPGVILSVAKATTAFPYDTITQHTAEKAYDLVLAYGGCSLSRDAVDTRVVNEVKGGTVTFNGSKTGKKGILDSQTDAGGWPVLNSKPAPANTAGDGIADAWKTQKRLDLSKNVANGRNLSTAYDNLEVYINSLVEEITTKQKGQ